MRTLSILPLLFVLAVAGPASAQSFPVRFVTGQIAASPWDTDPTRFGYAIELQNVGVAEAEKVRVTSIRVQNGSADSPTAFDVGEIGPGEFGVVSFTAVLPLTTTRALVTINGTYEIAGAKFGFSVNRAVTKSLPGAGPFTGRNGAAIKQAPNLAAYPTPPAILDFGPNAESPILIPPGPPRQVLPPTPTPSGVSAPGGAISIPVNTTNRNGAGVPPDPSAATAGAGGVVLATYNTGIEVSTDGGATFSDYNLFAAVPGQPSRTSFFPQSDGGLCCDQVVIYLPQQNLFVWLLQYNPITACATNCVPSPGPTSTFRITQASRLRIAWATPAQVAANFYNAWTYADLTATSVPGVSTGLGLPNSEWLDYPDLAYSGQFLYVGVDRGFPTPGQVYTGRRIVARLSLQDIANPAATAVNYQWVELTGSNGLNKNHFVQNAPGRMVVASLDSSSKLKVFTWDDSSPSVPAANDVTISSVAVGSAYTSPLPDGTDWVAVGFPGNITGGTFRTRAQFNAPPVSDYIVSLTSGINGAGRPRPYVRLETLRPTGASTYAVGEEYDIWHPDYAYAIAALGSGIDNVTPSIGLSLFVGGGTIGYPQGVVGYKDTFVLYSVTGANAAQGSRFGDYVNVRLVPGTTDRFGTQTYEVILPGGAPAGSTCATAGCSARMRYVEFEPPPFIPPR